MNCAWTDGKVLLDTPALSREPSYRMEVNRTCASALGKAEFNWCEKQSSDVSLCIEARYFTVLWYVTPWSLIDTFLRFGENCCLPHKCFVERDIGSRFLWNVSTHLIMTPHNRIFIVAETYQHLLSVSCRYLQNFYGILNRNSIISNIFLAGVILAASFSRKFKTDFLSSVWV